LLTHFHDLSNETVEKWEYWLAKHASQKDLESANWARQIIDLSMTPELKSLVADDLADVPGVAHGAIRTLKIATNHMVLRSQEAVDSLHDYFRFFDIRQFDGESVKTACIHIRAVI
jgi:hypothetical protein